MSPLEAARNLAGQSPSQDGAHCIFCIGVFQEAEPNRWKMVHIPECPWLAMPNIVAALEAAEAYLAPGTGGGGSLARLQALEAAMVG